MNVPGTVQGNRFLGAWAVELLGMPRPSWTVSGTLTLTWQIRRHHGHSADRSWTASPRNTSAAPLGACTALSQPLRKFAAQSAKRHTLAAMSAPEDNPFADPPPAPGSSAAAPQAGGTAPAAPAAAPAYVPPACLGRAGAGLHARFDLASQSGTGQVFLMRHRCLV